MPLTRDVASALCAATVYETHVLSVSNDLWHYKNGDWLRILYLVHDGVFKVRGAVALKRLIIAFYDNALMFISNSASGCLSVLLLSYTP